MNCKKTSTLQIHQNSTPMQTLSYELIQNSYFWKPHTAWNVSKYRVISGLYFPVFNKRTGMPKFDFNKAALQLYWNHTSASVFSWKFVAYFQETFSWEHLWKAASATCFSSWLIHGANTLEYICCQIKTYALWGFPQISSNLIRKSDKTC